MDPIRQAQLTYVQELLILAFYAARGVRDVIDTEGDAPHLAVAIEAAARITLTDQSGADLETVRETATATLLGQDFRDTAISLFLDDLLHEATQLAREMRSVAP